MKFLLLALLLSACETPKSTPPTPAPAVDVSDVQAWLNELELLRDRKFKAMPTLQAQAASTKADVLPQAAARDREHILKHLFGYPSDRAHIVESSGERLSGYESKSNTLWFAAGAEPQKLKAHVLLAGTQALNGQHFDGGAEVPSWDAWLAKAALDMGDGVLVAAKADLQSKELDPDLILGRPDLAERLSSTSSWMALDTAVKHDGTDLRERAFILREGLVFAASLVRSGGWSTLEAAKIKGVQRGAGIVRPDLWLKGDLESKWRHRELPLPDSVALEHTTSVGPVITGIWLSDFVDRRVARAIYGIWQSDSFRIFRRGDEHLLVWVTFWASPDAAMQMRGVFESALERRRDARFVVVQDGASVAVVGGPETMSGDFAAIALELVKDAPQFFPEPSLQEYVPGAVDSYLKGLGEAELDAESKVWIDPASQVQIDFTPLKDWRFQTTEDAKARLLIKTPDEQLFFLVSTELSDPLGPAFGTEAMAIRVVDAFKSSFKKVQSVTSEYVENSALGNTLYISLNAELDGVLQTFNVWIFESADALVTLSLRGKPGAMKSAEEAVQTVIASVKRKTPERSPASDGILEFKVED